MSEDVVIFDSHVHVASPNRIRYPVTPTGIGSSWWQGADRTVEAFQRDMLAAGGDRAVLVHAVGPYAFDNAYVLDAVAGHDRFVAVVAVDLDADGAEATMRELAARPSVVGVRFFAMTSARRWISSDVLGGMLDAVAELGLTVVVTVTAPDLETLRPTLERSPVPILLDHCGFPEYAAGRVRDDQVVLALADAEQVHLKVTTQCFRHAGGDGSALVEQLDARYGSSRLLWGSDHPQTHDRYRECVDAGIKASHGLGTEARDAFLGGNAARLFGTGDDAGERATRDALRPLAEALAADGYVLDVDRHGDGVQGLRLTVRAGADACADCMVPKEVFASIVADRLRRAGVAGLPVLRYPDEA